MKAGATAVIMRLVEHNNDPAAAAASVDHAAYAGLPDDLMARVAPCFARRETRLTCRDMVNGLLSELEDHNCWTLAEAAGHASPYRMQHRCPVPALMSGSCWMPPRTGRPRT